MRLFKRRCSDPSPQLVSLSPISHDVINDEVRTRHHQRPPPGPAAGCRGASAPPPETNKKGESSLACLSGVSLALVLPLLLHVSMCRAGHVGQEGGPQVGAAEEE